MLRSKTLIFLILLGFALSFLANSASATSTPQLINYQGVLTDRAGNRRNGNFDIQFSIWDDRESLDDAVHKVWPAGSGNFDEHIGVSVRRGVFSVLIGGGSASGTLSAEVFAHDDNYSSDDRYLQIEVKHDVTYEILWPRSRITSVGYAFIAANVRNQATFIVAASNSLDKTEADYVCTGSADQNTINAAIDALPVGGGMIYLREGTYNLSGSVNINKSRVTLAGAGPSTILEKGGSFRAVYITSSTNEVRNLYIDGKGWGDAGIYIGFGGENKIIGNTCNNNGWGGINIYPTAGTSDNNTIIGNTCKSNGWAGIYLNLSSNNIVTGNICDDNSGHGIFLDFLCNNNTITGNTCNNNGLGNRAGINIESTSSRNTITGNTCNFNKNVGLWCSGGGDGNTVIGNICNYNTSKGIILGGPNNTVTGNTCSNNDYGIWMSSASDNTITGNTALSNTTADFTPGTGSNKGGCNSWNPLEQVVYEFDVTDSSGNIVDTGIDIDPSYASVRAIDGSLHMIYTGGGAGLNWIYRLGEGWTVKIREEVGGERSLFYYNTNSLTVNNAYAKIVITYTD